VYTFTHLDDPLSFTSFSVSFFYDLGIYSGSAFGGLGGGGFGGFGNAEIKFSDTDTTALNVQGTNNTGLSIFLTSTSGGIQYGGTCGSYCAVFSVETVTIHDEGLRPLAVPGPLVGGGLPGLAMGLGGLLAWRLRVEIARPPS
jgi:hypothetical protein